MKSRIEAVDGSGVLELEEVAGAGDELDARALGRERVGDAVGDQLDAHAAVVGAVQVQGRLRERAATPRPRCAASAGSLEPVAERGAVVAERGGEVLGVAQRVLDVGRSSAAS